MLLLNLIVKKILYDNLPRGQNINIEILKIFARDVYERVRCCVICYLILKMMFILFIQYLFVRRYFRSVNSIDSVRNNQKSDS